VIVITGGTGFVGTWLAGLLAYLNDHHQFNTHVILVARNIDSFKATRPHLAARRDIKLVSADIRHYSDLPMETNWIIHAAASPDNRLHATQPLETMSVIANGTYSILRAAERCSNFKMLLNMSSGLIYGAQPLQQQQISETYAGAPKCATVTSAYAEAKRYAETLCAASRSQARMPVVIARPFAFIGPYQSLERPWAINNFINEGLSGKTIRILGDGNTVRSYLYASDMAYWTLAMLARGESGEIFNLGSDEAIDLKSLATLISQKMTANSDVQLSASGNQQQTSRFIPDLTLAQTRLKLTRTVDLQTALVKTIKWHQL
jgi:dTDP-glucose 4,6-dehydratase